MEIGVLTYIEKHKKTYDTLCLLKAKGYHNVKIFAKPYHYHKNFSPLIEHRPELNIDIPDIAKLAESFGYELHIADYSEIRLERSIPILLCGAGIMPDEFVKNHRIINAHPGYIPNCRGLDAFKWAILEKQPIGVTTHFLGENIDAGEILERRVIEIKQNDTFHCLAQRVYDNEIDMLVSSLKIMDCEHEFIYPGNYKLHKRMPHEMERVLLEKFEEIKDDLCSV